MTFEKLKGSLSEFIYSMDAAEIDFLPYQFKPVLKFVESPNERLLLADEVGLGKTIEAALIWLELQARRDARRLLVVCPNMLAANWRSELRGKFNVPVEICDFKALSNHLSDLRRNGKDHRFALIATYSSLRPPRDDFGYMDDPSVPLSPKGKLVRDLQDWNEDYPFADLVIFDEAHQLRNPSSLAARTAQAISNATEGLLCASATPVNNKHEDLRSLLRLLDPGVFENGVLFNILLEENRPAVKLGDALAVNPPNLSQARENLSLLKKSKLVGNSQLLPQIETLIEADSIGNDQLAKASRLVEQVNFLGRYVARTRRRQVAEHRAERKPLVVPVEFNEMESKFYHTITRMVREHAERGGTRFSVFSAIGPQIRMASCIPAMVKAYQQGDLGNIEEAFHYSFGFPNDDFVNEQWEQSSKEFKIFLHQFDTYDFEANDSKYACFRNVLLKHLPDEKVVVFSFYLATLAYLKRRLEADGESVAIIHGKIDQDARNAEIERFAQPDGPRILLSSEVGSEGINLQFAQAVVNYDLPWNPMRVEQRIGRIDRVGQQASIIHVVQFKVAGTIEGRLFELLHKKLNFAKDSLGDLEAIIGEEIEKLTADLFRKNLTPEEEERRIAQTERILEDRAREIEKLEKEPTLIGLSDFISARINRDRKLGRFVTSLELRDYIDDFFARNYRGCTLAWDSPDKDLFRLELNFEAYESLENYLADSKQEALPEQRAKKIVGTLNPDIAKKRRRVEGRPVAFINHLSPLIRWITEKNRTNKEAFFNTAALKLQTRDLTPGIYVFWVERWAFSGLRKMETLAYAVTPLYGGQPIQAEKAEHVVKLLLDKGEDWLAPSCDQDGACLRLEETCDLLARRCRDTYETFEAENQNLQLIQREQADAHFQRRIKQDEQRLQTTIDNCRRDKAIALARSRLEKARERRRNKLDDLARKSKTSHEFAEIAGGIFLVEDET